MVEYIGSFLNLIRGEGHIFFDDAVWYCIVRIPSDAKGCGMHFTYRDEENDKSDWHEVSRTYTDKKDGLIEYEPGFTYYDKTQNKSIKNKIRKHFKLDDISNIFIFDVHVRGENFVHRHTKHFYSSLGHFIQLQSKGVEFALYHKNQNDEIIWGSHNYKEFWGLNDNILCNYFDDLELGDPCVIETEYVMRANCDSCDDNQYKIYKYK